MVSETTLRHFGGNFKSLFKQNFGQIRSYFATKTFNINSIIKVRKSQGEKNIAILNLQHGS